MKLTTKYHNSKLLQKISQSTVSFTSMFRWSSLDVRARPVLAVQSRYSCPPLGKCRVKVQWSYLLFKHILKAALPTDQDLVGDFISSYGLKKHPSVFFYLLHCHSLSLRKEILSVFVCRFNICGFYLVSSINEVISKKGSICRLNNLVAFAPTYFLKPMFATSQQEVSRRFYSKVSSVCSKTVSNENCAA